MVLPFLAQAALKKIVKGLAQIVQIGKLGLWEI
jgi:hypothetical protein